MPGGVVTREELRDVARAHAAFLKGLRGGKRADLRHRDLTETNLTGVNLEHAVLAGAIFRDCVLSGARFAFADLFCADFARAELADANFARADLRGSKFRGANLTRAVFEDCDLRPGVLASGHRPGQAERRHVRRQTRRGDTGPRRSVGG